MASEKQLIDANMLKANFPVLENFANDLWPSGVVRRAIDNAPTVDAVEVVRCKDCRWARPQDHREPTDTPEQMLICQCFKNHHIPSPWGARLAVNPEHFCSYGERKDNE